MPKLFIKTWGCQMNVYDSARMADVVAPLGYVQTDDPAEADLVIFNTCHIREKAADKLFSELGRLYEHKKAREAKGQSMLIAVAGCVAQAAGEEIQRRAPYVDMVFGPQTYHQLPAMLAQVGGLKRLDCRQQDDPPPNPPPKGGGLGQPLSLNPALSFGAGESPPPLGGGLGGGSCPALDKHGRKVLNIEFPPEPKFDYLPAAQANPAVCAFLTIQEGCDRFCSYCVVPYTRGAEYSRSLEAIAAEAKELVSKGVREITLLGQNVNAWHDGDKRLGHLLRTLGELPGLLRLRYMTSYPSDVTDDLIAAHRDVPQVMPFLHLPVQSGSDRVLQGMNRKHTADDYRRVVDKLRKARPDLALSSDFIVGFPGETDEDFEATMALVREVGFAQAFSFKYSRRPGTPAAAMADQVPLAAKNARLQALQALLFEQQESFNDACVGRTLPVLFESAARRKDHVFGRTPYLQNIVVHGSLDLVGRVAAVRISGAGKNNLEGVVE